MVAPFWAPPTGKHTVASLGEFSVSLLLTRRTAVASAGGITRFARATSLVGYRILDVRPVLKPGHHGTAGFALLEMCSQRIRLGRANWLAEKLP